MKMTDKNGLRIKNEMKMMKKDLVFLSTLKKEKWKADPHLAHCLLPDTRAKTSQKSKSQIFTTHVLHVNRSLKNLNKCHFTSHIKESNFAYSKIFQKLLS